MKTDPTFTYLSTDRILCRMKRRYLVLLFLILLNTQSCWVDPCDPNCSDSYSLYFRIMSMSTGQNLVYGPNKMFDRSQMKVFSIKGADTSISDVKAIYGNRSSDSTLYFHLPAKTDTAYLQLNTIDIDTLTLIYGLTTGRCCSFTSIKAVNYNNRGMVQTRDSIVAFKK